MVENIGIRKTFEKIEQTQVVVHLVDGTKLARGGDILASIKTTFENILNKYPEKPYVIVVNKMDLCRPKERSILQKHLTAAPYPLAKTRERIEEVQNILLNFGIIFL